MNNGREQQNQVVWKLSYTDCMRRKHRNKETFYSDFSKAKEKQRYLEACNQRRKELGEDKEWFRDILIQPIVIF